MEQGRENDLFKEQVLARLNRIESQLETLKSAAQSNPPSPIANATNPEAEHKNAKMLEALIKWYNALWKHGFVQPQVLAAIRLKMEEDADACVIGYRDQDQAMIDRTFAEFVPMHDGRLFVIKFKEIGENEVLYAALPYPANDIWFNRGLSMLERLYTIRGDRGHLNPRVRIGEPAILKGKMTSGGLEKVFTPYRTGTMLVE